MSDSYYASTRDLLKKAVANDDVELVKSLFAHVIPLTGEMYDADRTSIINTWMASNNPKMLDYYFETDWVDDESIYKYVKSRCDDPTLDRNHLEKAIACLGQHRDVSAAVAAFRMDYEVLSAIIAEMPNNRASLQIDRLKGEAYLGAILFEPMHKVKQSASMSEVLAMIERSFSSGLLDPSDKTYLKEYLFNDKYFESVSINRESYCHANIPIISGNTLNHPELPLSFDSIALQYPFLKDALKRCPAYVKTDEVSNFSSARRFMASSVVNINKYGVVTSKDPGIDLNLKGMSISDIDGEISEFEITIRAQDESVDNISSILRDEMILSTVLDPMAQTGLSSPYGYTLCMIDVLEIVELDFSVSDIQELERTRSNSIGVINEQILSHYVGNSKIARSEIALGVRNAKSRCKVFSKFMTENPIVAEKIIEAVGEDIVVELVRQSFDEIGGHEHAFLKERLKLDMPKNFKIDSARLVEELYSAGYTFSPSNQPTYMWHELVSYDSVQKLVAMGAWPSRETSRPESVHEGLKQFVRKPEDQCLKAYLQEQDPEVLCKTAKSEPQWRALESLLRDEHPELLVQYGPPSIKRSTLSSGVGL